MNTAVRTTVVYAVAAGLAAVPAAMVLNAYLAWSTALKLTLWAVAALYGWLMARWSGTRLSAVLFPLAVLLGSAFWPRTYSGFFVLALGVLSWMRSGICFQGAPVRALVAEVITMAGGAALLLVFGAGSYAGWGLNICLFFLVQSLYFFIVPLRSTGPASAQAGDPFEQAVEDAKKVLEGL